MGWNVAPRSSLRYEMHQLPVLLRQRVDLMILQPLRTCAHCPRVSREPYIRILDVCNTRASDGRKVADRVPHADVTEQSLLPTFLFPQGKRVPTPSSHVRGVRESELP